MGTLTAQSIVDEAWELQNDTGTRWPAAGCLRALNNGQREIVTYLPSAWAMTAISIPVAGTRQTLSGLSIADGLQFIDITRNFNSAGTVPGEPITRTNRGDLDDNRPGWHTETGTTNIQHWMNDPRDPKAVYVWPPALGATHKIEVIYSAVPTAIAAIGNAITLDDIYANAMMYYLLFRMRMKNKQGSLDPQGAQQWYSLMLQSLGIKDQRVNQQAKEPA